MIKKTSSSQNLYNSISFFIRRAANDLVLYTTLGNPLVPDVKANASNFLSLNREIISFILSSSKSAAFDNPSKSLSMLITAASQAKISFEKASEQITKSGFNALKQ